MFSEDWRFYGRRMGRRLRGARQEAMDSVYPALKIPETSLSKAGDIDPCSLFNFTPEKIVFEIGFGNGERLVEDIRRFPQNGFIGAEAFVNGVAAFLRELSETRVPNNIRVLADDAIPLARSFIKSSVDIIYVLNPDPWHKPRHHKRRLINQDNLDIFSKILKPGGLLVMSTDVEPLAEWMVTEATKHKDFSWTAQRADDWRMPPVDWIHTKYETKRAKGAGRMNYLIFKKV